MNPVMRLIFGVSACLALAASAVGEGAPPSPSVLVNFTESLADVYGYGSWQNRFGPVPKAGFLIAGNKGAMGDGGFCKAFDPVVDLENRPIIEIALAVQPRNEVPSYAVGFEDEDGTQCFARVFVGQLMPGQPVWLRVRLSDFAVSKQQEGADGAMNWRQVAKWHLQGDWITKKPACVLFVALRARSS